MQSNKKQRPTEDDEGHQGGSDNDPTAQEYMSEHEHLLWRLLISHSRDGVVVLEEDGSVYYSNRRFADMLGYGIVEMKALHVWDWDRKHPKHELLQMLGSVDDAGDHFVSQQQRKDGSLIEVEISTNGTVFRGKKLILCIVRDITDRRQAERVRDLLAEILEATPDLVAYADPDGTLRYVNAGGRRLVGLPCTAADTSAVHDAKGRVVRLGQLHPEWARALIEQVAMPAAIRDGSWEGESALLDATGGELPVSQTLVAHLDEAGEVVRLSTLARDIRRYKELEEALERLAFHDGLTGVTNRRHLEALLEEEAERCERHARVFSLVMYDLDHFKLVNDNHGHQTGDEILRAIARIVEERLRGSDVLGRWGGEEFMILLPETGLEGAAALAEDLRATVAATTFPGPGRVTISLGVAQYRPGEPLRDLIKRVDEAVYRAKNQGRNRVALDDRT